MRAFIAIDLPEAVRVTLRAKQAEFRAATRGDDFRWTRPEGVHLTLKFLGEISARQAEQVRKALGAIGSFEPFPIEVKGFGFFPDPRRPRVFWAGLEAPPALEELARRIEAAMEKQGFAPDERPFRPHLTLARFKNPRPHPALESLIQGQNDTSLGRFEVAEFFLFESKLSPGGAEYRKLVRFPATPGVSDLSLTDADNV